MDALRNASEELPKILYLTKKFENHFLMINSSHKHAVKKVSSPDTL